MADRSHQIAWAAGFLDGEGCFSLFKRSGKGVKPSTRCPAITVCQINRKPLDLLVDLFGGRVREGGLTQGGNRVFHWELFGEGLVTVIPMLIPFLVLKHDEARLVYEYAQTIGKRGRALTDEQIFEREQIISRFDLAKGSR